MLNDWALGGGLNMLGFCFFWRTPYFLMIFWSQLLARYPALSCNFDGQAVLCGYIPPAQPIGYSRLNDTNLVGERLLASSYHNGFS